MPLRLLTAGESHGPQLVAILEGMVAGLAIDAEFVNAELERRQRGIGAGPRMKVERDQAQFIGGVLEGLTTGAPLAITIPNLDHARWKGRAVPSMLAPRPGHADLTGALKYGYADLRPALERASARETALRVAAGAVCKLLLREVGIRVFGYVIAIGEIEADLSSMALEERGQRAEQHETRCPHPEAAAAMAERVASAIRQKDTLGGVIEVAATGLPIGLGSHVQADRRLGARLAAAVMGTQAIKGVEIGEAFANARRPGTQVQDAISVDEEGRLTRATNYAGGLEGGMTNGQPLIVRAAMKPIATTLAPQKTVNLATGESVQTEYERSDFCPVPRAVPILEGVIALVLADALLEKLGGDTLQELKMRFAALPQGRVDDFRLDVGGHLFWP